MFTDEMIAEMSPTKAALTRHYMLLINALRLAETSKPYIDSEAWAVSTVVELRRETANALKEAAQAA